MDDRQFYYEAWNDSVCNRPGCDGATTKLCIDAQFASSECGTEPPLFVCDNCANMVRAEFLLDIVQPIGEVAASCENKPCKGDDRTAKYTCFSESCIKKQRYGSKYLHGQKRASCSRLTRTGLNNVVLHPMNIIANSVVTPCYA